MVKNRNSVLMLIEFSIFTHYEATLCILCTVNGFCNRQISNLLRNPQHCYNSLIFFAVLDSTNKYLKHCTVQNLSKKGEFAESLTVFRESSRRLCGIHKQIMRHVYSSIELLRIRKLLVESATCKWNPQLVSGFRKL